MAVGSSDEGAVVCGGEQGGRRCAKRPRLICGHSDCIAAAHDFTFVRAAHCHAKGTDILHAPSDQLVGLCLPAASLPRRRCRLFAAPRLQVGLGLLASTVPAPHSNSDSSAPPRPARRRCRPLAAPRLRVDLALLANRLLPCSPPHTTAPSLELPIATPKTLSSCTPSQAN
jgi:hypothetical protein